VLVIEFEAQYLHVNVREVDVADGVFLSYFDAMTREF